MKKSEEKDMYDTVCEALNEEYSFVRQLKKSEKSEVLVYRHNKLGNMLCVKRYNRCPSIYEALIYIKHDNLPKIYEVAQKDGKGIVLEEYIDGITVSDVISEGMYTEAGMCKVVVPVLRALKKLHENDIIHRDIKPENIMLQKDGRVKLIDFDAAKKYKYYADEDTTHLGTNGYAAPEQYGIAQSDQRSDIYAVGVLMNVMLTGEHPSNQLYKGALGRIIKKCIQVNREDRYQNVDELIKKLSKRCNRN